MIKKELELVQTLLHISVISINSLFNPLFHEIKRYFLVVLINL